MSIFDLIIFDCDGTLVDSEYLNCKSCSDVLIAAGFPEYTVEVIYKELVGVNLGDMCKMIEDKHGRPLPADITERVVRSVQLNAEEHLKPMAGALEVVRQYSVVYDMCVASNGEPENVSTSVSVLGFNAFISDDAIYTAYDVARPKPEPDLFLYAAEKHGCTADRCLVVEDTVTGVKAAKAAGMMCFGIVQAHSDDPSYKDMLLSAGADHIMNDWSEFSLLVEGLLQAA